MSENLRNYTKAVYTMDAIVRRVEPGQWDNQSPCAQWSAREVLGHAIWHTKRIASNAAGGGPPVEQAEADVAGSDPMMSWAAARDAALAALDQKGALAQISTGPFGESLLDQALTLPTMDLTTHAWDIATATGQAAVIPEELAQMAYDTVSGAGDAVRRPGILGPATDVADDADIVTKFAAMAGRQTQ